VLCPVQTNTAEDTHRNKSVYPIPRIRTL
jgi:hypothetical protein